MTEPSEQFIQIKNYLSMQAQMGTLNKFRYDESYASILNCADLQAIHDMFYANGGDNKNKDHGFRD